MAIPNQSVDEGNDYRRDNNRQRILLAKELSITVKQVLDRWDEKQLTINELMHYLELWFINNDRRRLFIELLFRSQRFNDGYPDMIRTPGGVVHAKIDVNLLTGPYCDKFKQLLRTELFNDFAERFRELHEAITQLAWLIGGSSEREMRPSELSVPMMTDILGL